MDGQRTSVLNRFLELTDQVDQQENEIRWLVKTLDGFRIHYIEHTKICATKIQDNATFIQELEAQKADLEEKLRNAQKLLYNEKQKVSALVKDRKKLMTQLEMARDILRDEKEKFHNETKEKLSFLNFPTDYGVTDKLDTILELDSTDIMMSELSYTLDDDDSSGDKSSIRRSRRTKRVPIRFPSEESLDVSRPKKSRDTRTKSYTGDLDERIVATTTVTVPHKGPVSATSIIEAKPSTSKDVSYLEGHYLPSAPPMILLETDNESAVGSDETGQITPKRPFACQTNLRLHQWVQKSHIMGESCSVCSKKIKFSSMTFKCSNCKAVAHVNCRERVPIPCVPVAVNTPAVKSNKAGSLADFVPATAPLVPSLVVHCIREIEARGFNEVGLYRVPGSDKEVKTLKEKLMKARGVIDLSGIPDIHAVCGCLKEFIRSLKETLIPQDRWKELSSASDTQNSEQRKNRLFRIIQSLPQANRDTLAYIVLHLQRVSASPNCKMPVSNLSKMFGPSIVGYSKYDPDNILMETNISNKIMAELLLLPTECWEQMIYPDNDENQNPDIMKTPSQHSLHGFFDSTPSVKTVRKFRFFETP